jgi:hypothetical protein
LFTPPVSGNNLIGLMARPVDMSVTDTAAEAALAFMGVEMALAPLGFAS